jgi:hypothetical protein
MRTGSTAPRRRLEPLHTALTAVGALLAAALILSLGVPKFTFHHGGTPGSGSGVAATQTRSLPPFTHVNLAGDNNVFVRVGAKQSVVVHADRNLLARVTTRVRACAIVIYTTPGNLNARSPMYVVVSVPSLDGLALEGAGNIGATGIDAPSLSVTLPGSGNIEASGSVEKLDVTIDGEGTVSLRGLVARDAKAELAGGGTIALTATHSLSASLSGTGTIFYGGNPPHFTQRVTGTGTISAG